MILDDELPVAMARRALAPPGQFSAVFPGATDADLGGMLADAFGAARLDGFFPTHAFDAAQLEVTPDLTDAGLALVIAYMARSALQAKILTMATATRYKAGPTEAETTPLATVLNKLLDQAMAVVVRLQNKSSAVRPIFTDGVYVAMERSLELSTFELPDPYFPRF